MRALEFITGHVIYNTAYMYLQIPTENHLNLVNFVPASLKLHNPIDNSMHRRGRRGPCGTF